MAHEIETAFFAKQPAWHGLGVRVPENVSVKEAMRLAGLDWKVGTMGMQTVNPLTGDLVLADGQAIFRLSDGRKLGESGKGYQPIQNEDAFAVFDGLRDKCAIHTAGSLRNGERVWMLAQLPGGFTIGKNDKNLPFLLATTGHDGKLAFHTLPTSVRVVCANTLRLAIGTANGENVKVKGAMTVKHRGNVKDSIAEVTAAIDRASAMHVRFGGFAGALSEVAMSGGDMRDLAQVVVPENPDAGDRHKARVEDDRSAVLSAFYHGAGNKGQTGWDGLNAVTEWTATQRGQRSTQEARMEQTWFGEGDATVQRAVNWLSSKYSLGYGEETPAQQHVYVSA